MAETSNPPTPPADLLADTGTPPPAPAAAISADELVAPLGTAMPPVTEPAAGTPPPVPVADSSPFIDLKDSRGTKFNPERHAVDETGKPKKNSHGNFYSKTTGRPPNAPGAVVPRPSPKFDAPGAPLTSPGAPLLDEYDAAAEVYLNAAYGPLIVGFSEKARPDKDDHAALKVALANYLRVKKVTEPSPGWALLFVITAVAVKKSEIPEVKERAISIWQRAKNWISPKPLTAPIEKTK